MREAAPSSPVNELGSAVAAGRADGAVEAALAALRTNVPPLDLLRGAALASARHYDPALRLAPMGLVALASSANLFGVLQPRFHALPTLQAIAFAAAEKKSPQPARPPLVVRGEITHLGRSFLFATRDGDVPEAEAIFLGILPDGSEHRMAGDMLFRAALEDMGDGGLKLVVAVKLWQLARSFRFRDARVLLRPAIQYLTAGTRDSKPYQTILATLGKEWVDLEALATGGRPLDGAGHDGLAAVLPAADESARVEGILALLRDGYSASSVAEALSVAAARHVVRTMGRDRSAALAFAFAHAARFVVTFSRSPERIYAVFQAALRIRDDARPTPAPTSPPADEGEELCHLAGDLEARRPAEAAARVGAYLTHGHASARLLDVLANYAARDAALPTGGWNLLLADVGSAEHLGTRAPDPAEALAAAVAATPGDWTAYNAWAPLLGA